MNWKEKSKLKFKQECSTPNIFKEPIQVYKRKGLLVHN